MHAGHEILRVSKATRRYAAVLIVRERHSLPHGVAEELGDAVVADGEIPHLRCRAGNVHHRQLAFPRFADPTFP